MKKRVLVLTGLCVFGLVACKPQEPSVSDSIIEKKEMADKVKAAMDQGAETSKKMLDSQLERDAPSAGTEEKTVRDTEHR